MLDPTDFAERLERHTGEIAAADAPSDLFRALLDGFALASPRAAMFLVRKGTLTGWSSTGYGTADADRIRGSSLPAGSGWPGRMVAPDGPDRAFRSPDDRDDVRDLGAHGRRESLACALRVGGRTLAVLLTERDPGERPWSPAAMGVLMTVATMRLEVDLARRRLERETPAPPAEAVAVAPPGIGVDGVIAAAAPEPGPSAAAPEADPELETARRFARLIATDIRLYNEEDVLLGRKNGDLQHRIRDHLVRGQETFRRRYPTIGDVGEEILHEAYVRVLAGGDASLIDAARPAAGRGGPTP
jgi:hypothetical protein